MMEELEPSGKWPELQALCSKLSRNIASPSELVVFGLQPHPAALPPSRAEQPLAGLDTDTWATSCNAVQGI